MSHLHPLVSVVIPTANRPRLVTRAIGSVLQQTFREFEIVVVMDGENPQIRQALQHVDDPRLHLHVLDPSCRAGAARNIGVKQARAPWVALLDDDDEWLPQKLEVQLATAQASRLSNPIISCRLIARTEEKDFIWPRRVPEQNEPFCEYLFCRRSPFWGEGLVQTSTILTTKKLLQQIPFSEDLNCHQDLDWLLRANTQRSAGTEFVAHKDPLAIWNIQENRTRISNAIDWQDSAAWIHCIRSFITPRAYAAFLLTWAGLPPARSGQWKAFLPILVQGCRYGEPRPLEILTYLAAWTLSPRRQRKLAMLFHARQRKGGGKLKAVSS